MAELNDLFRLQRHVGPESLVDLCFELICKNLDIISKKQESKYHPNKLYLRHLLQGLILPCEICEKLVEYVLKNNTVEFHDEFFNMFSDTSVTKLRRVKIKKSNMTDYAAQILASHKLVELELTDCRDVTEAIIEHLNANAVNLQSLAFRGAGCIPSRLNMLMYRKRGYVFKMPNLRSLALEKLSVDDQDYSILLHGLTNLRHLDLSNNFRSSLVFCKFVPNLISLILYNNRINNHAVPCFVDNICSLKNLRHLDISYLFISNMIIQNPSAILSEIVNGLPQLISLDISGTNLTGTQLVDQGIQDVEQISTSEFDNASKSDSHDIPALASRVDRPLHFLGLYQTYNKACSRRNIPAKLIAGDENEDQILVAAFASMNNKPASLRKVLNDLYKVYRYGTVHRIDQGLCVLLEAMEKHPEDQHIQITGSATLFCIVTMKEKDGLDLQLKKRIIRTLLTGMTNFKDEEIMMRNGCLVLRQFRIPEDVMSCYEALIKLLLYAAKYAQQESITQRIEVFLLNCLACQVSDKEKRLLGELGCIEIMLKLIKCRVKHNVFDDVLEVAWSTMWNITDETPVNCERFLDEKGMELFHACIKQYPQREELLKNMMGLLGNIAEVKHLRVQLMQMQYIRLFAKLLCMRGIEVSYNAAGVLAHIASDGEEAWTVKKISRAAVLEIMVRAIGRWSIFAERNIHYRSFVPLLRLLDVYHTLECQHWAVWAIANLTAVYPHTYCMLVIKEGGIEKLNALIADPRPYERIKELAHFVIKNCSQYTNSSNSNNTGESSIN